MAEILVIPDVLISAAGCLDGARGSLLNAFEATWKIVDMMSDGWEGKAQSTFQAAFEAKKKIYQDFSLDMTKLSQFLREYAHRMEMLDAGSAQNL